MSLCINLVHIVLLYNETLFNTKKKTKFVQNVDYSDGQNRIKNYAGHFFGRAKEHFQLSTAESLNGHKMFV